MTVLVEEDRLRRRSKIRWVLALTALIALLLLLSRLQTDSLGARPLTVAGTVVAGGW